MQPRRTVDVGLAQRGDVGADARTNRYGFLETPYRRVKNGRVTDRIEYLSAIEEGEYVIAQANANLDANGELSGRARSRAGCRMNSRCLRESPSTTWTSRPKQIVSVAASLIPFLEHDDANRALMGSNMQRQAVPTLRSETPLVGTGMERPVAIDSGVTVVAQARRHRRLGRRLAHRRAGERRGDHRRRAGRRHLQPDEVHALQPEHLHQPASAGERGRHDRARRRAGGRPVDRTSASLRSGRTCWSRSCPGTATTSRTRSSSPSAWCRKTASPPSTSRS